MSAADWQPSERGWRSLQRRASTHGMVLLRTDPDDGPPAIVAISEDGVRLFRSQHQIDMVLDLADQVARVNAGHAHAARPGA